MTQVKWMERTGCLLQADMFDPHLEPVVKTVLDGWRRRKAVPSLSQLSQLCYRHDVKAPVKGECGDNYAFDHEEVLLFARDRILREQMAKAHLHIEDGKHDRAITAVVEARNRFPRSGADTTPDILTTRMTPPVRTKLIPTGLELLDDKLGGGVAAGELATVLAPTSGGKSSLLSFMAAQAVLLHKKVWYATLEVTEADIRGKIERCLLRSEKINGKAWEKEGRRLSKSGARLQVFETPPHTISADDLDGIVPDDVDVVFVDYADYLRAPNDAPGLSYENLGHIYTTLKSLALSRKISVWTASQVNRAAYEADEIYTQHVAESLKKMMVCDIGISVNQNRAEQDPDVDTHNCVGRLFIAKNRGGPRYISIDVTINWAMTLFKCGRRA